jgi:hypothetical protein
VNPLDLLASPIGVIIGGYAAWYLFLYAAFPWGRCRRCHGTRHTGRLLRRPCRRCNGTGIRVRIGRRIYRYLRAEYFAGTRTTDRETKP